MIESNDYSNLLAMAKDKIDQVSTKAKRDVSQIYKDKQWSGGYYDICRVLDQFQVNLIDAVITSVLVHDQNDGR